MSFLRRIFGIFRRLDRLEAGILKNRAILASLEARIALLEAYSKHLESQQKKKL